MRKRDHNIFANAASLLICGVLTGIVVAAVAFPVIAMGGLAARAGVDGFGELPTSLKEPSPPQRTYVYASDGTTLLAMFLDENRKDIPFSEMPLVMRQAIVAAEDQRFYEHNGVDVQGIVRALVANQQTGDNQGASTLTQQYVRQAQTYSATSPAEVIAATEQTNARKLREARLALALETSLTETLGRQGAKDKILENYLNIAAFGHSAYGIYAASQVYFNKEPKDLKLEEAALLAALPKAPTTYDPVAESGRKKALERRVYVLNQMVKLGYVTQAEADAAQKAELKVTGQLTPNGCTDTPQPHWGFFCDYFYRWWLDQPQFGKDEAERGARLKSGGYRITTTIDLGIQDSAHRNVEAQVPTGNSDALMVAVIEPGSGRVKALAANRTYGLNTSGNKLSSDPAKRAKGIKGTYPVTTNPILTGGVDISGYKSGSTFKMFTMLAALEKGYPLDFQIVARSPYPSKYITGVGDQAVCPDKKHWCPKNATPSMNGPKNMWTAFGGSVNTYFVPLEEKIGADAAIDMSKRLGIHYRNTVDQDFTSPAKAASFGPFTLGVSDTVPLELANAYATIAADGKYCEPIPIQEVFNKKGEKLTGVAEPRCSQVVKPEVARAAVDAARCPILDRGGLGKCEGGTTGNYFSTGGNSTGSIAQSVNHPVFGKTGTSDNNWTANLVIATKQLAIASTLANPDYAQTPHTATQVEKTNKAAVHTMRDALAGAEKIQFIKPPNELIYGKKVAIPPVTCKTVAAATSSLRGAGFDVSIDDTKIDSVCPAGTVAKSDPEGSTSSGSQVTLQLSNGKPPTTGVPGPNGGG